MRLFRQIDMIGSFFSIDQAVYANQAIVLTATKCADDGDP